MGCPPLSGVRAIELAEGVAGPYLGKLLADLGAEVIKVEKPRVGDFTRGLGPFKEDSPHSEKSGLFFWLNTNKLGVTLSLDSAKGRGIFLELARNLSLVIEDRPPGWMELHGLGFEDLKKLNPSIVLASIQPFGLSGPYADYKATPLTTFYASGLGYLTPIGSRFQERPPLKWGRYASEATVGLIAAVAVLAALYAQKTKGVGQHVEVSKQEALMSLIKVFVGYFANEGRLADRFKGLLSGSLAFDFFSPLKTKDGYAVLFAAFERQLKALGELVGGVGLEGQSVPERIREFAASLSKAEVYEKGQAARIPTAPIHSIKEVLESKQMNSRGFFKDVEGHRYMGGLRLPSVPFMSQNDQSLPKRPAPLLGEHNAEVLGGLGFSKEDIKKLFEAGVI